MQLCVWSILRSPTVVRVFHIAYVLNTANACG